MHPAEKVPVNRRPVIFIAGPMAGKPYFNRDEFYFAAKQLDDLDFIVLNPAIFPDGLRHGQYMKMTLAMLKQADAIYLLNEWETSKGARAGVDVLRAVAGCGQRHHYPATVTAFHTVNRASARFIYALFNIADKNLITNNRQYQIHQKC
ncbi:DUF4406 domain-containing protein [Erwinia tracheiphila]|uniref:DUF4406 domain-containing protein n=2 Tax=Erwinia tracheiphila TaxID=65700 RepID=A0A345CZ67_9GAMM|nr:DUF4406 domain-containing protein [Erwinia tracheiphila]